MAARLNSGLADLDNDECLRLLKTKDLGRLGVIIDMRPEIFPVNYAVDAEGAIVFRSGAGPKLAAALSHPVAFEVDGTDDTVAGAWSVVVHGTARLATSTLPTNLLLTSRPPDRPTHVRITPGSMTGRRLDPGL